MVFLAEAGPGPVSQLCCSWKRQERAAKHGSKHGSMQERGSHELHKHLLGRFTKGSTKIPNKIPPFEQEVAAGYELCSSRCCDVTQEQFLLLLFQQGEGGGVVPLQVLAVLALMLLCQGGTPCPGPHCWVVTLLALGALVVEFLGVLAVQEVSLPWEAEGSRGSAHQLPLSLQLFPGAFPPQIHVVKP